MDILTTALDQVDSIKYGFFGRTGGESSGAFASLNCGLQSGDDTHAMTENRNRVKAVLAADKLVTLKQVHGNHVAVIDANSESSIEQAADGLVTKRVGIAIGVLTADCAPVLFVDANAGIVGAAHAGWRGAVTGVTDNVIDTMVTLGATIDEIQAVVGPTISWNSYQVDLEFQAQVMAETSFNCAEFFKASIDAEHLQFNLPAYVLCRLRNKGIKHVQDVAEDTYRQSSRYFSFRRNTHDGIAQYGRQISAICLI